MNTQLKGLSETFNQPSNINSSMDFMTSLSAADNDKSVQEKLEVLHNFGKSFERGYHYQCELNEKLKQHLQFKEKEYKMLEEELNSVKEKLNVMKIENRKLEDAYFQLAKEKDQYKAECKKLRDKLRKYREAASNKNGLSDLLKEKLLISESLSNDSPQSHTESYEEKHTSDISSAKLPNSQGQQKHLEPIKEKIKEDEDNSGLYASNQSPRRFQRQTQATSPRKAHVKLVRPPSPKKVVRKVESPDDDDDNDRDTSPALRKQLRENGNHVKAFSEGDEVISGTISKVSLGEKSAHSKNLKSLKKLEIGKFL